MNAAVCAVLIALLVPANSAGVHKNDTSSVLHLLTLLPDGDVADSLLPAAELAVDTINAKDDLLPGYRLELIAADTELRNETLITESYISFVKYVASEGPFNVVGVTGMTCATVTQAISPLAGRPDIDLLQISAGELPPTFTNVHAYPRLYQVISSSAVQNDALLALMDAFEWRRISIISDSSLIDHTDTANDFITKVNQNPHLELISQEVVTPRSVVSALSSTILNAAKIIYVSSTAEEARELLCTAYHQGRLWPAYVWIFRNLRVEDFLQDSEGCDTLTMQEALENSILVQYRKDPNDLNSTLVSGQTYSEYQREYQQRLRGNTANPSVCANALHDSVWAFALALNQSLENLTAEDLQHYRLGNSNLTSVITNNMQMVNFSGATGQIHFNEFHESDTEVHIFQIQSGEAVHIGSYNPMSQNLTLHLQPSEAIPEDDFEIIRLKLHPALPIVTLVAVGLMLVLTTIVLILFLHQWNKPAIKATSPYLSLLIFAGCYLLYGAVIILALREYMDNFGELCQSEFWFDIIGTLLIYGTLFVRLLRVYRIFFHVFQKPGKFWTDWSLFIMVLAIVTIAAIILLLWSTLDPMLTIKFELFMPNPVSPFHGVIPFCDCTHFFAWTVTLYYVYIGSIVFFVVVLAILTRKVKVANFKDTKEVSMFVFTSAIAMSVCFAYETTFANAGNIHAAYTFEILNYFGIAIPCKAFLFIPKIWSAKFEKRKRRSTRNSRRTSYQSTIRKGSMQRGTSQISLQSETSVSSMRWGSSQISLRRESSVASTQRAPPQIATQKALLMQRGSLQMSTSPMDKMGMRPLHIATDRESIMRRVSLPIQIQRPSQDNEGLMKHPLHINNSYTTNQTDM